MWAKEKSSVPRELVERVLRTTLPVGILDDMLRASRASQYVLVPARRLRLISVAEWGLAVSLS
jgi:hypothetical protein